MMALASVACLTAALIIVVFIVFETLAGNR
mgnify:CR=1 FL=1